MDTFRQGFKSIKTMLFREQSRILSAATSLMILTLLTKFSGMLFTALIAQKFGASRPTDIFNAANTIPEMITTIILVGAVSGSVIPVLIKIRIKEGDESFSKFFNSLLNLGLITFIVLSIILIVFSHSLVGLAVEYKVINPTDSFTPTELKQIGDIMRMLMVPQAILGVSAFVSSALNVYERFIIPSLAPLFYNLGRIIGVFVLVGLLNGSIYGVVWGAYIGAFAHLLIQLPLMRHLGINYSFKIDFNRRYLRDIINLGVPRIISLAGEQVNLGVNSILAISLHVGSLTAFGFGLSLISIPLSLFGATFAVAAFPSFSKFYEKSDMVAFSSLFRKIINQIFFLAIPATIVIIALRVPLTRLFFGILGGQFNWEDTRQVAWVIFFLSLGLPFETLRSFMYRIFYAMHDSKLPFVASFTVMVVGIMCSLGLVNYFSHYSGFSVGEIANDIYVFEYNKTESFPYVDDIKVNSEFTDKLTQRSDGTDAVGGLALSLGIVFTLEFMMLMVFLKLKNVIHDFNDVVLDILRKFLAGALMLAVSYSMFKFWENILSTTKTFNLLFLTGSTVFASLMFYLWISYVLRVNEVDMILDVIENQWKKYELKYPIMKKIRKSL